MANHKSAKKRIKTNEIKRQRNKGVLTNVKTVIKNIYATADKSKAEEMLKDAVSVLDKTASKGRIHKNNVSRKKAQLTKYVNGLAAKN